VPASRSACETDLAACATWSSFGSRSSSTLMIRSHLVDGVPRPWDGFRSRHGGRVPDQADSGSGAGSPVLEEKSDKNRLHPDFRFRQPDPRWHRCSLSAAPPLSALYSLRCPAARSADGTRCIALHGDWSQAANSLRAPTPLCDRLPQTICDIIARYRHQQTAAGNESRMSVEAGSSLSDL